MNLNSITVLHKMHSYKYKSNSTDHNSLCIGNVFTIEFSLIQQNNKKIFDILVFEKKKKILEKNLWNLMIQFIIRKLKVFDLLVD